MIDAPKTTPALEGMTLRDYIAIAILQGWMTRDSPILHNTPDIFDSAYWAADQMLKVRKKMGDKK